MDRKYQEISATCRRPGQTTHPSTLSSALVWSGTMLQSRQYSGLLGELFVSFCGTVAVWLVEAHRTACPLRVLEKTPSPCLEVEWEVDCHMPLVSLRTVWSSGTASVREETTWCEGRHYCWIYCCGWVVLGWVYGVVFVTVL